MLSVNTVTVSLGDICHMWKTTPTDMNGPRDWAGPGGLSHVLQIVGSSATTQTRERLSALSGALHCRPGRPRAAVPTPTHSAQTL